MAEGEVNLSDILFRLAQSGEISESGMKAVLGWREQTVKRPADLPAISEAAPLANTPEQKQAVISDKRRSAYAALSTEDLQYNLSRVASYSSDARAIEAELRKRSASSTVPAARPALSAVPHQVVNNVDGIRLEALVNKPGKSDADWAEMRRLMGGK